MIDKNNDFFIAEIMRGWEEKKPHFIDNPKVYYERLTNEINVINNLGLINYFLIVHDIIRWAEKNGIMIGPGRGSSGGSLVCYLLGITKIDPIKFGLYFERFLNVSRADMADIDTDCQDNRRSEIIDYIRNKYGMDNTCNIGTFSYLSPKSAFRDVASVFGIPSFEINTLSKMIDNEDSFSKVSELIEFNKTYPHIVEQAIKLSGTIKSQGTHAAGVVISSQPISDVAVLEKRGDIDVCNWDKKAAEKMGLLKVDLLGLSTLSILSKAKELIWKHKGIAVEFDKIPLDDLETIRAFQSGFGVGVFQFENAGVCGLLKEVQPKTFYDLATITALFRPGPLSAKVDEKHTMVQKYIQVAKGNEYPTFLHPKLKPILKSTNGVIVFQEQIMRVFVDLAGFTLAEADQMRKIIGRKMDEKEFEPYEAQFVSGCAANGVGETDAKYLFDQLKKFAGYGFNLAHSVEYAHLSFWSMWLKVHYPLEYMTALLNNTTKLDKLLIYVHEGSRLGVVLEMPEINRSSDEYSLDLESNSILVPLGAVKGVGSVAVDTILAERKNNGPFISYDNFDKRVAKSKCNKRIKDFLIRAGVFKSFGVINVNIEERDKDMSELIPVYNRLPSLKYGSPLDVEGIQKHYEQIRESCPTGVKFEPLSYLDGTIMFINRPQKNERILLSADGTKYLLDRLRAFGIDKKKTYHTSLFKCFYDSVKDIKEECVTKCLGFLKEEIKLVKPKLIVTSDTLVMGLFMSERRPSLELNGMCIYSKEFNCHVIFSISPQYAYYQDKLEEFDEMMEKLAIIFGV